MFRRMRRFSEIKWSEVARRAIAEYLGRMEGMTTTEELRKALPPEVLRTLKAIPEDRARNLYEEMVAREWKRTKSLTRTS
ncbi:MAG: hypothetical protein GXO65_02995 [Euryarchaeota archaeon]|nr:hypothetical protein [Euryarchaeota archaeon]